MFYVFSVETICPHCREISPNFFGITQCKNLRVVKHRVLKDNNTDLFIRNNPKLYACKRESRNLPYAEAYTILCSFQ